MTSAAKTIEVAVLDPNGVLRMFTTSPHYKDLQKLLGGPLELLRLPDREFNGMYAYIDEEGLFRNNPRLNRCFYTHFHGLQIYGNVMFSRSGDNNTGEELGLLPADVDHLKNIFKDNNF
jgi:hypothetical protein